MAIVMGARPMGSMHVFCRVPSCDGQLRKEAGFSSRRSGYLAAAPFRVNSCSSKTTLFLGSSKVQNFSTDELPHKVLLQASVAKTLAGQVDGGSVEQLEVRAVEACSLVEEDSSDGVQVVPVVAAPKRRLRKLFRQNNELLGFPPEILSANIAFLESIGVQEKHILSLMGKCPAVLVVNFEEVLGPLVNRVQQLGVDKKFIGGLLKYNPTRVVRIADSNVTANIEFLSGLGIAAGQIARVVRGNPQVLVMDVVSDFQPSVDFLYGLGLDIVSVRKVIIVFPTVLGLRVEQNLKPKVEYLKAIGVAPSNIGKVIVRCPPVLGFSLDNLLSKVEYLQGIGISSRTLKLMVERCPAILGYSIEKNMQPKIRYLESVGVERKNISKILGVSPNLLGYSVKKNLQPKIEYLKSLGVDQSGLSKIITTSPVILSYSLDQRLKPTVKFLSDMGFSNDRLVKLIISSPSVFSVSIEGKFSATLQFFSRLGIDARSSGMVRAFTSCFSNSIVTLESRLRCLSSYGFSDSDVHEMVNAQPALLTLSDENLRRKIEFLKESTDFFELKRWKLARFLTYSLEFRMRPRHELMSCMKSRGVLKLDFQFTTMLELSEKQYQDRFVMCHLADAALAKDPG